MGGGDFAPITDLLENRKTLPDGPLRFFEVRLTSCELASPAKDIGPENLHIRELVERVRNGDFREVILATNPNVEGEATAVYLSRLLKPLGVALTRPAQGLPAGSDLEYIDELTLQRAFEGRREY